MILKRSRLFSSREYFHFCPNVSLKSNSKKIINENETRVGDWTSPIHRREKGTN